MIRRGGVYLVDLDPTRGREQARKRPVLVVSDDAINSEPLVVAVVVGTGAEKVPRDYPTNVRVKAREAGLPRDTVFLCFQIRSLDAARLVGAASGPPHLAGRLPSEVMTRVDAALRLVLGLG